MKPSEVLNKAAKRLEKSWSKQFIYNPVTGGCCIRGAIAYAKSGHYDDPGGIRSSQYLPYVCEAAKLEFDNKSINPGKQAINVVARFNDAPERTQQECVDVLRKAAKLAEEVGQ